MSTTSGDWGTATLGGEHEYVVRLELTLNPSALQVAAGPPPTVPILEWIKGLHTALRFVIGGALNPEYKGLIVLQYVRNPLRVRVSTTWEEPELARGLLTSPVYLAYIAASPLPPLVTEDPVLELVECLGEAETPNDLTMGNVVAQVGYLASSYSDDLDGLEARLVERVNYIYENHDIGSLFARSSGNPLQYYLFHSFDTDAQVRTVLSSVATRLWDHEHPLGAFLVHPPSIEQLRLIAWGPPNDPNAATIDPADL